MRTSLEKPRPVEPRPLHRRGRPSVQDSEKKRAATYRLSPEAHRLIGALVSDMGLSQAAIVETAVRDLATARGLRQKATTKKDGVK